MPVWLLNRVPLHYQEEARIILQAKHGARMHALGSNKVMPTFNVDLFEM